MTPHKLKINNDAYIRGPRLPREINTSALGCWAKNEIIKLLCACLRTQLRAAQIFIICCGNLALTRKWYSGAFAMCALEKSWRVKGRWLLTCDLVLCTRQRERIFVRCSPRVYKYNPDAVYHNRSLYICTFHAAHSSEIFLAVPSFTFRPADAEVSGEKGCCRISTPATYTFIHRRCLFCWQVSCADADDTERNIPIKTHISYLLLTQRD